MPVSLNLNPLLVVHKNDKSNIITIICRIYHPPSSLSLFRKAKEGT